MANISSAFGTVQFNCTQETLDDLFKQIREQGWCYGVPEVDGDLIANTPLTFNSIGRWNFLTHVDSFFETLNPIGEITIDWEFTDSEPGLGLLDQYKGRSIYTKDAENKTDDITKYLRCYDYNAKNLMDCEVFDLAGDTFTKFGIENLQDRAKDGLVSQKIVEKLLTRYTWEELRDIFDERGIVLAGEVDGVIETIWENFKSLSRLAE